MSDAELEIRLRENVVKAIRRLSGEGARDAEVLAELESALNIFVAFLNEDPRRGRRDDSREASGPDGGDQRRL